MSKIAKEVGLRIRSYRLKRRYSQEALAERAGCHSTYIGQLERGEKNATLESIEKISLALNVPMSKLFENLGGDDAENDAALKCYNLVASKNEEEQEQLLLILSEIDKYKDK